MTLKPHWRTSMNVGALVTLVAAVHYMYMREYWVKVKGSPIVYRYIDWSITVPLQMVEFYLILSAVNPNIGGGMFWRLLIGTVAMLTFGYLGESLTIDGWVGFIGGMLGWAYILYEIFAVAVLHGWAWGASESWYADYSGDGDDCRISSTDDARQC